QSQDSSIIGLDISQAKVKLQQYDNQDSDIQRVELVDSDGNERIVINNHEFSTNLTNVKKSDAFKVVTQISNDVSLSDVTYENGEPKIIIAVPILSFGKLRDQDLTNAQSLVRRFGADIKGALI